MSVSGILVLIALTVGVLTFVAWPLINRDPVPNVDPEPPSTDAGESSTSVDTLNGLQTDYEATLSTLRDLDFDFQTGKLAPDDYQPQREALVTHGADLLRQIDTRKAEAVEAAIRVRRHKQPG